MKTIAIIYPGSRYLERLTMAMQRDLPEGYAAIGYYSVKDFSPGEEHVRVKALPLYEELCEGDTAEEQDRLLAEMAARKIPVWLLTSEKERGEEPGYVFLDQPVDRILAQLGEVLGTVPRVVTESREPSECRCLGVISVDGTGSSAYAMQLARRCAVSGKTLLLCVNFRRREP